MRAIRLILFFGVIVCAFNACIEPFNPDIGGGDQFLVINGVVTDEEGYQYAEISLTSSYNDREYMPVNDCEVKIIDGSGNEFTMENYSAGKYRTWIEQQYLQIGNRFKIEVISNDGKKYESEFDTLLPCPDIDDIYYEYQEIIPDDPDELSGQGIQLYIDFDATGDFASNYRWEAIETWEYRSEERIHIIYNGIEFSDSEYKLDIRFLNPENRNDAKQMDSLYTCWKTANVKDIFTYTSRQKRDMKVIGLPLYFVTNKENKLHLKYSILIRQLTLSDVAFGYWNQLQTQSQETGGLYETQPYELEGNMKCIDNENETVIGFFSVSSVKSKRLTTSVHLNRNDYYCADIIEGWDNLLVYLWGGTPGQLPLPNVELPDTPLYLHPFYTQLNELRKDTFSLIDQSCIDCRLKGGTLTKPDYW